ncbi:MAG: PAS domain S-box protein [Kiritimatiellales bacterium]
MNSKKTGLWTIDWASGKKRYGVIYITGLLLLVCGIWVAKESGTRIDARMRRDLARQVINVAATIPASDVRSLSFTEADRDNPDFQRLSAQLKAYSKATGLRNFYTIALHDGKLAFGPESLEPGDPYASPPGTVYEEPTELDFEIFKTGKPMVQGPTSDEYGVFVTATAPVTDPCTGKVLLTVGLDVEAGVWKKQVREAQWTPFLVALVLLGILTLGIFLMKRRARFAPGRHKSLRHTEAVTCAVIMLLLTTGVAVLAHLTQKKTREESFRSLAQLKTAVYLESLRNLRGDLNTLTCFFESSEWISRNEFNLFCRGFINNNNIEACVWLPEVSSINTAFFEKQIRADGFPNFSIWQFDEQENQVPAQEDTFYPAFYIEPLSGHEKALGYNLDSEPLRRAAIREALRTGKATATDPITLITPPDKPPGFFIFQPVSAKKQKGVAGFAVRPEMLLAHQAYDSASETSGLSVSLFQLTMDHPPRLLACSQKPCDRDCWDLLKTDPYEIVPIFAFGKTYALLIIPEKSWMSAHPLNNGPVTLFLGLALTALMTSLISILANRPFMLERLVQQRTNELRESEERFNIATASAGIGVWEHDLIHDTVSGNDLTASLYDLEPGFKTGSGELWKHRIHPDDRKRTADAIQQALNGQTTFDTEFRIIRPDGEIRTVHACAKVIRDTDGTPLRIIGINQDITERKNQEAERRRLSTAIEQSPETVVVTDLAGNIQYVNPAFETITGYSRTEALGKNPRMLKSEQHDAAFYSNLWKTITSGNIWTGRFINKRKTGELFTEEASISPVRDSSGAISGYVAVKRNITEELAREERFQQDQKMKAVGQLAGGIAHDFNNILQAILGFSEILLNRLNKDSMEHRNAGEIQKAAKRAAEMTRQLLAFSRKQPIDRKRINLNAAVQDAEVLLQLLLGNNITFIFKPDPALHEVYADYGQLTQVIMNLAVNARDAMPNGGRLNISTENITFERQVAAGIPEAEPGSFVCLAVTDTGCGMSREIKDHLFEPFFTTKAVGQGTGLGLAVIYGIVKQNKGWIHVYSEKGLGTTFKVYLPACAPASLNEPASLHNGRILLVEDDVDTLNLVIRILSVSGYEIVTASNAEEATLLFEQEKKLFDLLFSDMILPGEKGIDLADKLRKKNPRLAVLLYSGYQDQRERWTNLDSKGYHFLQKPFSIAGLLAAVHEALTETIP